MNLKIFKRWVKAKIINPDNHPDLLAEALKKKYLTEEEVLKLRLERAEAIYKQFLSDKKK